MESLMVWSANAVIEQFLSSADYNQGVNTPHIVFNYLDYLLWKKNINQISFVFEFRNSVEHWYPRNPSEGTFEQWTHDDGVDRFGNLCLIQRNVQRWKNGLYKEHEDAMIKILKEACSFVEMPSAEAEEPF